MLSDEDFNRRTDLDHKYKAMKKVNDMSMGDIQILRHSEDNGLICVKEQTKNSKSEMSKLIYEARERLKLNMEYLIEMKDYSTEQTNELCSTFFKIRTYWEYQPNHLKKDMSDRKSKGQDYSTIELTHLLYNITLAGAHMQEQQKGHGCIRPASIAVLEDGKTFKLIDPQDPNVPPLQTQMNLIYSGKDVYLTPQIYSALKKNNTKLNHNNHKSDVFSFGLCILEAGLGRSISNIYGETSMNPIELDKLIKEFCNKYDDNILLTTSINKMLALEESDRPDFKTVIFAIPPYGEIKDFFENQDVMYDNEGGEDFTASHFDNDYRPQEDFRGPGNAPAQNRPPQQPVAPQPKAVQPQARAAPPQAYPPQNDYEDYHQYAPPVQASAQPVNPVARAAPPQPQAAYAQQQPVYDG